MRRLVLLGVLSATSCVRPAPAGPDTTDPVVTIQIPDATNGPRVFRSTDTTSIGACTHVRALPARVSLAVSDAGGVAGASFRAAGGTIDSASVVVPGGRDITWALTPSPGGHTIRLTLTRTAPDSVRTGVVASFSLIPRPGASVLVAMLANGTDYARNAASTNQVDLYDSTSAVICR
jgi:hypothetical protein